MHRWLGWLPRPRQSMRAIYPREVAGHMLKDDMKVAIAQHACSILGEPHGFRLQWAALEPRWASARRDISSRSSVPERPGDVPPTTVHVVTRASVTRVELLGLVEDALWPTCRRLRTRAPSGLAKDLPENRIAGATTRRPRLNTRSDRPEHERDLLLLQGARGPAV